MYPPFPPASRQLRPQLAAALLVMVLASPSGLSSARVSARALLGQLGRVVVALVVAVARPVAKLSGRVQAFIAICLAAVTTHGS
jgi:hypothetical protein